MRGRVQLLVISERRKYPEHIYSITVSLQSGKNNKVLKDGRKQTDKVNKPSNYSTGTTERTAEYHCQPQALREMCGGHDV